ncbi:hypothetical protein F4802DRAFT_600035 [Xylaria palmicola]|nr:hypothetical protein F4802DRAFT_600035 [Xylaria palmicola]
MPLPFSTDLTFPDGSSCSFVRSILTWVDGSDYADYDLPALRDQLAAVISECDDCPVLDALAATRGALRASGIITASEARALAAVADRHQTTGAAARLLLAELDAVRGGGGGDADLRARVVAFLEAFNLQVGHLVWLRDFARYMPRHVSQLIVDAREFPALFLLNM